LALIFTGDAAAISERTAEAVGLGRSYRRCPMDDLVAMILAAERANLENTTSFLPVT